MKITLKNYRCFPDSRPAQFEVRAGFTALVGRNNSGKSSLLKFFHEFRALFQLLSQFSGDFQAALTGGRGNFAVASIFDLSEIFSNSNSRDMEIAFEFSPPNPISVPAGAQVPTRLVVTAPNGTNTFTAKIETESGPVNLTGLGFSSTTLVDAGRRIVFDLASIFAEFQKLSDTLYIGPFRNAINVGTNEQYFDIQVGQGFISQWKSLKTGNVKRNNELILKLSEDIKRIFEFDGLQIDASSDGKTLQVFINQKSYKLPELGSGLTQFIVVLGNAAIRQPAYILIDEPELNLHPSLTLDFLTTLASYAKLGIIFGTHSVGLARAAADRIYSLRTLSVGESQIRDFEATPSLLEFLGELGFSGYQELGGKRILLVEGPKDVTTLQQFLRLRKLDHKFVLLPLGGSTLINTSAGPQLLEIKRICDDISALIDSERSVEGEELSTERQGFVAACEKAGIRCHVLTRRATENYLTDRAVKKAMGGAYRALGAFEKLGAASPTWSKSENWRIAREMTLEDLRGTDLGSFLDSL
jgi:energy-coupling factor transporter ATP-binding protein EcfA2